jgi:hypothetical protein
MLISLVRSWSRIGRWLDLDAYFVKLNKTHPRQARPGFVPRIELCEDRIMPSTITSTVIVNGGAPDYTDSLGQSVSLVGQNSVVEQLQVTFNESVTLDANAFRITNIAEGVTVLAGPNPSTWPVDAIQTPVAGSSDTQWIVTFSGAGTNAISGGTGTVIKDGLYLLTSVGAKVHAESGGDRAADNNVVFWALNGCYCPGSQYLTGSTWEVCISGGDFTAFVHTFGSESDNPAGGYGQMPYNPAFDFNLDGVVDGSDYTIFRNAFNAFEDWQLDTVVIMTNPGDQTNNAGYAPTVYVDAIDVPGNTVTFSADGLPGDLSIDSSTGVISGPIGSSAAASSPYEVTVTATDSTAEVSVSRSFNWTVTDTAPSAENGSLFSEINTGFADCDLAMFAGDANGDTLTPTVVTGPSHGTLTQNSDGKFAYVPNTNWTGTDTLTYKVNDGIAYSGTATISIETGYSPPVAQANSYEITSGAPTVVTLEGTSDNNSTLAYYITDLPTRGTLYDGPDATGHQITSSDLASGPYTVTDSGHRVFFVPQAHKFGVDSLYFGVSDSVGQSEVSQISLSVVPPSNAPSIADALAFDTYSGGPITGIDLASFVNFPSGSSHTITVNQPEVGTLSFSSGTGKFNYTADATYTGPAAFSFEASDGTNSSLENGTFFCQQGGVMRVPEDYWGPINEAISAARQQTGVRATNAGTATILNSMVAPTRVEVQASARTSGEFTLQRSANLLAGADEVLDALPNLSRTNLNAIQAAVAASPALTAVVIPGLNAASVRVSSRVYVTWRTPTAGSTTGATARIRLQLVISYSTTVGNTTTQFSSPFSVLELRNQRLD